MKRSIVSLVCGVALCAAIFSTEALAAKRGQKMRIKEDVKNGTLTRQEAKQLKGEMKALRAEAKAARAGGKLDPQERERLKAELKRLNEEIGAKEGH
ncbi:MAG TPA: hypothetical protein VK210_18775 [Terriglobia bacterium]|nr:hypothetical protein [Terriglobia bacterium]